ncbi:thioredoxin-like protein [Mollisia scopiformis]|uniref:Thioredoxin-like protein n=1 Tax=Mollisia scopiformis TaxID=149040 RepID=A0A194XJP7_MOLSC|nr:thioredoxin-like protein [Mollisia scopiformis]KUJ20002.1 thioredoxin-like protein [Mollisia scopiformis]
MSHPKPPNITLYFLQSSRSIRTAWLLEELSLPYTSIFFPRINNKAPPDFASRSGNSLGKAPTLVDGDITLCESGAIAEYLVEKYDEEGRMGGGGEGERERERVRMWVHAAEGTFMVHCLAVTYARWFATRGMRDSGALAELEGGLGVNVGKDLDWLERELEGRRICVQFIFARDLTAGRKVGEWKNVERWIRECEATESYKRAVKKTGHEM